MGVEVNTENTSIDRSSSVIDQSAMLQVIEVIEVMGIPPLVAATHTYDRPSPREATHLITPITPIPPITSILTPTS